MTSENFYKNLAPIPLRRALREPALHVIAPDDWVVVMADITESTRAVTDGRYKDVNVATSCAITAVLNAVDRTRICFLYGGDGASFLIPSTDCMAVACALYGTQQMVSDVFGLHMRAGMVPMDMLKQEGLYVRVAKTEIQAGQHQSALSGTGLSAAEQWIKSGAKEKKYLIEKLYDTQILAGTPANFDGFECRWETLQSRNGYDLSLIIASRMPVEQDSADLYTDIMQYFSKAGQDDVDWKPVSLSQLDVNIHPFGLSHETKVRGYKMNFRDRLKYSLTSYFYSLVGLTCLAFGLKAGSFDGRSYRQETVRHSDFLKFENALKMIMDVSGTRKSEIESYLEDLYRQGKIFYGLHAAPSALITCLVFDYEGDHIHFIDGGNGGYTMAAMQMKQQMAQVARL